MNSLIAQTIDDRGYIVKIGDQAPDFSTTTTDGKKFDLKDTKGKVVMLQFTASWCGVCRKEMPLIETEIWQAHKNKGLVVVGIDLKEPLETIKQFRQQTGVTYPLLLDIDGEIFEKYADKEAGVTRNVLIDRNGKIIFMTRLYNEIEFKKLVNKIAEELDKN